MRRMLFEKTGKAVWMSHLDLMRLMQRAFRRAGVLLHHSQGFTPHAYVSMPLPLSVGVESICEIMEYELDTEMTVTPEEMNRVMPEGIRVIDVYESSRKCKELTHLKASLEMQYDGAVPNVELVEQLFCKEELLVEKKTKRGIEETDIRPMMKDVQIKAENDKMFIECIVCAQNPSLNPMMLISAIERYLPEFRPDFVKCRRLELLDAQGEVFR